MIVPLSVLNAAYSRSDAAMAATIELEAELDSIAETIAPTCSGCRHFQKSQNFQHFGKCGEDGTIAYVADKACSRYQRI